MSPGGPSSGPNSMPQSPNRPSSGPPNSQPMFVRPVHQSNQIQMISPSGQIITGQNQPVNSHAQTSQIVNQAQPTLVDQNGQIIHAVQQQTPPANEGQFKQIIMSQNGQIIQQTGSQGQTIMQHNNMGQSQLVTNQHQPNQNLNQPGPPNIQNNIVTVPNGLNVQMAANNQTVMQQEVVHPMIQHGQINQPGVKIPHGQVIMNGQFRPSPPIQMDANGQMIRMSGARGPSFAPGPPLHVPPRSPITSRGHPQRILQQKPMVVPLTCIEEELHQPIQHKYVTTDII